MDKKDVLEFLNKNPVVYLATCDGKKPRVRGMLLYRADENGIVFHTGTSKDLHRQLVSNPDVEICGFSQADNKQVRVSGKAECVEDAALKKEIVEKRPFMKPWLKQYGPDILAVWRIKSWQACVWTMATNFSPKEFIRS